MNCTICQEPISEERVAMSPLVKTCRKPVCARALTRRTNRKAQDRYRERMKKDA